MAFRLPYDFEPIIRLRTFYKNTDTLTGTEQEAWALGGFAGLRSPWFGDLFQFGVVGYTSQRLYGPAGKGGTLLLQPDQSSITVLGEAFGAVTIAGQTLTGYRQLIDRPFINPQDTRELPNTFEAYTLTGASGALSYTGGYMTKMKTRASDQFVWASQVAGGKGPHEGVIYAGATYAIRRDGLHQSRRGVLDRRLQHVLHRRPVSDRHRRQDAGDAGRAVLPAEVGRRRPDRHRSRRGATGSRRRCRTARWPAQVYYTQTGTGFTTQSPYGDHPSYLNLQQIVFNTAGEKAWAIRGTVDFATIGAPGLTATAIYASGKDRVNSSNGAPLPNHNETDVRADYAFAKGTTLEGLVATFRYSWLHQDGSPQTQTDLRAILNYGVRF